MENGIFWSEIGSGFGEPGGTPLPKLPRSTPSPRGTRIRGKLSCTEVKCTWLLPSFVKEVPYAKMRYINLTSARKLKADLDEKIENLGENREATSSTGSRRKVTVQVPTQTEMDNVYANLNKSTIKPVALSLIEPYSSQFVSQEQKYPNNPRPF